MMKFVTIALVALVAMIGTTTALVPTPVEKDEIARMDFTVPYFHDLSKQGASELRDMNNEYLMDNRGMVQKTLRLNKIRLAFGGVMNERIGRGTEPSEERQEKAVQKYHDAVAEFLDK